VRARVAPIDLAVTLARAGVAAVVSLPLLALAVSRGAVVNVAPGAVPDEVRHAGGVLVLSWALLLTLRLRRPPPPTTADRKALLVGALWSAGALGWWLFRSWLGDLPALLPALGVGVLAVMILAAATRVERVPPGWDGALFSLEGSLHGFGGFVVGWVVAQVALVVVAGVLRRLGLEDDRSLFRTLEVAAGLAAGVVWSHLTPRFDGVHEGRALS